MERYKRTSFINSFISKAKQITYILRISFIIGTADSETVTSTSEAAELIIRLRFANKESVEIKTCDQRCNTQNKKWRDILDQGKVADEFFRELLENR